MDEDIDFPAASLYAQELIDSEGNQLYTPEDLLNLALAFQSLERETDSNYYNYEG